MAAGRGGRGGGGGGNSGNSGKGGSDDGQGVVGVEMVHDTQQQQQQSGGIAAGPATRGEGVKGPATVEGYGKDTTMRRISSMELLTNKGGDNALYISPEQALCTVDAMMQPVGGWVGG